MRYVLRAVGVAALLVGLTYAVSWAAGGPVPSVGLYWQINSDPTAGGGVCAPQWQLLFRTDNNTAYYKSGTACTAWTPFAGAGAGTVSSVGCSTGLTCSPSPITGTGTVAITNTAVTAGSYTNANITVNAQGQITSASNGVVSVTGTGTANTMTMWTGTNSVGNSLMSTDGNGDLKLGSGALALWSSTSLSTGTADTGIARNAAGVLEVDNGTAGTLRDLTLRNLTVQNGSLGTGSGQAALFTTPRPSGTDGNNICIGGGCASLAFNATVGIHSASSITSLGIGAANAFGSGADIVAIGSFALDSAAGSQATQVTAVGASAMINATGAIGFDTAVGQGALENTTAGDNTALGQAAMLQQTSGGSNTAVGVQALEGGAGATCILDVAVGLASNQLCTTGAANTAVGYQSMANATSASSNVAVGYNAAGSGAMTGNRNVCVGVSACSVVDAGYGNTQIGNQAGSGVTSGSQNTIVGPVNASFIGTGAGITTGSYNTILGSVTGLAAGLSNNVIIADGQGNIRYQDAAGSATIFSPVKIGGWIASPSTPSANHGTLSTGATGAWGQITSIGSFTSVALTWASAYANDSLCTTQPNSTSVAIENIVVTAHNASAVTFSCFSIATGLAANCDDFTYNCAGR